MRPTVLTDKKFVIEDEAHLMLVGMKFIFTHLTCFLENHVSSTNTVVPCYCISLWRLYIKLFWMKKEKEERWDGMLFNRFVAEMPAEGAGMSPISQVNYVGDGRPWLYTYKGGDRKYSHRG